MNSGRFDVGVADRMAGLLERLQTIAEKVGRDKAQSNGIRMRATVEKRRCRRAWWRMQATADELAQELSYCRAVLRSFGGSSAKLEAEVLNHLNENEDELISLY